MSSNIWMQCGGVSSVGPLRSRPWRAVEAQHVVSTRKLTESGAEQAVLEELLEASKPSPGDDSRGLHYLLSTPFRYPPLRHGSRFGTRVERGIWYGAESLHACFAEVSYYRMLFIAGTEAPLVPLLVELTTFRAVVRSEHGVDLSAPPFLDHAARISSPTSYETSQVLGRSLREDGVEAVRFLSARDRAGGINLALFSPAAFERKRPHGFQAWVCVTDDSAVEVSKRDLLRRGRTSFTFPRSDFEVDGRLPSPAP